MRSGNGRHRRPRQVPAIVVTAGVTGSALALPLLGATGASAAETSTWDKVAECESGGTWSANSGSGAYGGLQFTQEEWKAAGGLDFAERADLASRSQQIAVAERVLASQGPQAWPLCATPAGLDAQSPAAVVDPGLPGGNGVVTPTPTRPDDVVPPAGSGAPAIDFGAPTPQIPDGPLGPNLGLPVMPPPDLPIPDPTDSATPASPADPTAPATGTPTPTAPTAPATPTPSDPAAPLLPVDPTAPVAPPVTQGLPPVSPVAPVSPADPTAPAAPGASTAPPVAPAEGGGGKHRGAPAVEGSLTPDAAPEPTYTVKAGDSLAAIADAKGLEGGWNALYEANEQVIGEDANLIKPGQNLDLTDE